jgi:Tol biopolymer transport system component
MKLHRLRSRFTHCVHAYAAVDAWDRAGKRLLYAGFDSHGPASIVVRDLETGTEPVVATTERFDFHTAAGQRWALDDTAVVFKSELPDRTSCPALARLDAPGKVELLSSLARRSIRHVVQHGENAFASAPAGVERVNLQTGQAHVLLTTARALEVLPKELRSDGASYSFNHPVPNADLSRFFCKLMKTDARGRTRFCAFYVAEPATGVVRCFGERISGHPVWMSDNRHILNVKSPRDGTDRRWLVQVDSTTGHDEPIVPEFIDGPGHPTQSPDGRWIATDEFMPDGEESPIRVFDLRAGQERRIVTLDHCFRGGAEYDPSAITRGQPHPVWSPCGRKLLVNCNHGGKKMQLVLMEDFLWE